ncbi:hypothetical protein GNP61_19230, partial [Aliivibrio fischeri]|uniref:HNH endonuclease n=1 Tax=Aliivibrio fischeri TaxID=668 RepID=UPI0012DAA87C
RVMQALVELGGYMKLKRDVIKEELVKQLEILGGTAKTSVAISTLATRLNINVDEIKSERSGEKWWPNEVRWAREALVNEGKILPTNISGYGVWSLVIDEKYPTEENNNEYLEGNVKTVLVNKYERNKRARKLCIEHFGAVCNACGFDFGAKYGSIAANFIHVHHIVELSLINKEYKVNPITDLIPLCANCHSVVHMTFPAISINELRSKYLKID